MFLIRGSLHEANVDADLHIVHDGEKAVLFFEHPMRIPQHRFRTWSYSTSIFRNGPEMKYSNKCGRVHGVRVHL